MQIFQKNLHKKFAVNTMAAEMNRRTKCDDFYSRLAAEIVIHAIEDWRNLVRARAWLDEFQKANCNFDELRAFFTGEWCEFLMQNFDITPAAVLDLLEAELAEAKRQPPKAKKHRKG